MEEYFKVKKVKNINVIAFLFSELSMENTQELKAELYSLVSESDNKFIINVQKCAFLPSMVIGILVSFAAKVHEKTGRIAFCCPPEQIRAIFSITKLDKIFQIYNTEDEALESFK